MNKITIPIYGSWVVEIERQGDPQRTFGVRRWDRGRKGVARPEYPTEYIPEDAFKAIGLELLREEFGSIAIDAIYEKLHIKKAEIG